MSSIYQEICETLDAIAAEISEGYDDYNDPETVGFVADAFNAVFEGRE